MLLLVNCVPSSQITRLVEPNGPRVGKGSYPGNIAVLNGTSPIVRKAESWRKDIENHESILRRIVRSRFDVKTPLEFNYMYTALDSARNAAVIRYFTFNPKPEEIAGWEVLLVYKLPRGNLIEAFVAAVPLE